MGKQGVERLEPRVAPLEMSADEFRFMGRQLVDRLAEFLASLPQRPITPNETPEAIRGLLGAGPVPDQGEPSGPLLERAADLLINHSLFNGHPRFWGYITSSAAPIGALADLLAGAVNPNVGGWALSPMATEIESQTVRWIAELVGYPSDCGGLLVSGGNMANFVGFLAARKAKADWDVRAQGMADGKGRLRVYTSRETHTWIEKAADLFGLGTDSIRWIEVGDDLRMDLKALRRRIKEDIESGERPFLVVGTAGSVSTGAIDPLPELATICRQYGLWFHVDGAYGGLAAVLLDGGKNGSPWSDLAAMSQADSLAIDPHKWLYAPLEAGCALVRDREALRATFSYHPPYYHFDEKALEATNYYEYGPQNSRGFRALKVWLALRQVGRQGYARMIAEDISLAQQLHRLVEAHAELEPFTQSLSITTFRYVPLGLPRGSEAVERYLDELNTELLTCLQNSGEAFVSNAVIRGRFVLRACVVNFRTSTADIQALPEIVARYGRQTDESMRPAELASRL